MCLRLQLMEFIPFLRLCVVCFGDFILQLKRHFFLFCSLILLVAPAVLSAALFIIVGHLYLMVCVVSSFLPNSSEAIQKMVAVYLEMIVSGTHRLQNLSVWDFLLVWTSGRDGMLSHWCCWVDIECNCSLKVLFNLTVASSSSHTQSFKEM